MTRQTLPFPSCRHTRKNRPENLNPLFFFTVTEIPTDTHTQPPSFSRALFWPLLSGRLTVMYLYGPSSMVLHRASALWRLLCRLRGCDCLLCLAKGDVLRSYRLLDTQQWPFFFSFFLFKPLTTLHSHSPPQDISGSKR